MSEAKPDRIWFGHGGCVDEHAGGTYAVYVRGELLGTYEPPTCRRATD